MDAQQAQGMQGFLAVDDERGGFVLAGRGLYEYKVQRRTEEVALTLLRSVGTISYGFEAWGSAESGYMPGTHSMNYAFCPFTGDIFAGETLALIDSFLSPVIVRQYPKGPDLNISGPALPDARLRFSAFKRAESRSSLIFRLVNISDTPVNAAIPLGRRYHEIWQCRLDETRRKLIGRSTNTVSLAVKPKKIVTLELVPAATEKT